MSDPEANNLILTEVRELRATIQRVNGMAQIFICTRALPWSPLMNLGDKQIVHFDAIEVDNQERECPYCKHRWKTVPEEPAP